MNWPKIDNGISKTNSKIQCPNISLELTILGYYLAKCNRNHKTIYSLFECRAMGLSYVNSIS